MGIFRGEFCPEECAVTRSVNEENQRVLTAFCWPSLPLGQGHRCLANTVFCEGKAAGCVYVIIPATRSLLQAEKPEKLNKMHLLFLQTPFSLCFLAFIFSAWLLGQNVLSSEQRHLHSFLPFSLFHLLNFSWKIIYIFFIIFIYIYKKCSCIFYMDHIIQYYIL